ncbi:hypothetical protein ACQEVF_37055 [Nonomuraea polychroma]|uniref:hypothetical protein n=1 Tax=Nonomuraea polychroma TaxID=46176 RepID=UPI003D9071BA
MRSGAAPRGLQTHPEASLRQRVGEDFEAKRVIAAWAAAQIRPGETVLLDAGSTTGALSHELRQAVDLTVATTGLNALQELVHAAKLGRRPFRHARDRLRAGSSRAVDDPSSGTTSRGRFVRGLPQLAVAVSPGGLDAVVGERGRLGRSVGAGAYRARSDTLPDTVSVAADGITSWSPIAVIARSAGAIHGCARHLAPAMPTESSLPDLPCTLMELVSPE